MDLLIQSASRIWENIFISLTASHTQGSVLLVEILSIDIGSRDRMINYINKTNELTLCPENAPQTE